MRDPVTTMTSAVGSGALPPAGLDWAQAVPARSDDAQTPTSSFTRFVEELIFPPKDNSHEYMI
jgi:hypothetical protein